MSETSRRNFLATLGAFTLMPLEREEPDLILHNGNFWTVDPRAPRAQAVAISDGRFLAVGSNDEILAFATARSRKIDLGKKTVLPGFIDAHAHPASSGVQHLRMVACDVDSIEAIQAALHKRAQQTPAGQWVQGFLYDDGKTPRPLTREDLDAAVPDHPVMVHHRGGHTVFVNSLAFKLAGVDEKTPDPPGGRLGHDGAGHLNGFVGDQARTPFDKLTAYTPRRDDFRDGAKLVSKMMASKGVTSTCDAMGDPESLQGYQDARDAEELCVRVYCHIKLASIEKLLAAGMHTGFGDEWVRIGALKLFADGSISERTAWFSEPYVGMSGYRGLQVGTREEIYEHARKAHAAGWQIGIHANGDLAIEEVLGIYEQLQREMPHRDPRFRIEHCTYSKESAIQRMRALNVVPVPFSGYVYFHGDVMHFYGKDRLEHMFPMRGFLDAGLLPADSSDYTASPSDPMMWLQSQLTRTDMKGNVWGPSQRITVEEALRCGTIHGAYASYEEKLKGSIEPGKLADLVVLGRDPLREDPSTLVTIPVERTMNGGKWVYES